MKPEDVTPANFLRDSIIFDNGNFSVAWGTWGGEDNGGDKCLGMRWNGDGNDPGYPKLFKNPVWFIIPEDLTASMLKTLLGKESAENDKILETLKELIDNGKSIR